MGELSILKERLSILGNQLANFRCKRLSILQSEHDDVRFSALIYLSDYQGRGFINLDGRFVPSWNDCFHDMKKPHQSKRGRATAKRLL
jgi:hypothetical protein